MKSTLSAFAFLLLVTAMSAQTAKTAFNVATSNNTITAVYPGFEFRMLTDRCEVQMWQEIECDSFHLASLNAEVTINTTTGVWHAQMSPFEWLEIHPVQGWTAHRRNRKTTIYTSVREWQQNR